MHRYTQKCGRQGPAQVVTVFLTIRVVDPDQPGPGSGPSPPEATFRLLNRLFTQIERIVRINELAAAASDVGEATCTTLGLALRPAALPMQVSRIR